MLVNGRPRHPQSQGSVERGNGSLKESLTAWMRDNNSQKWSLGLFFVQWTLNTAYHEATLVIPYKAVFDTKPRHLPLEFLSLVKTGIEEERLQLILEETSM